MLLLTPQKGKQKLQLQLNKCGNSLITGKSINNLMTIDIS